MKKEDFSNEKDIDGYFDSVPFNQFVGFNLIRCGKYKFKLIPINNNYSLITIQDFYSKADP